MQMSDKSKDRLEPNRSDEERPQDNPKDIREANENIRKAQGEDATGPAHPDRKGNRPRFDRDR